jgi:signal peptidase I
MAVLTVCLAILVRAFFLDSYQVPTGSMAPTLLGQHRACVCPRCGITVQIGLHPRDASGDEPDPRWYDRAWCPNCGATGLSLHLAPLAGGQRLLVDKTAFTVRSPRRWEVVVFHLFGLDFIKRLLGLPGETVEIRDGDVYIDGALCRKTLDEFKAMRVLVFDNNHQPLPMTWAARWESVPYHPERSPLVGTTLHLDAPVDGWHLVAYRHFCLDTRKCLPIVDEYGYNGAAPARTTPVHDLMLECDLEIQAGEGTLAVGITDGKDFLIARLAVGKGTTSLHAAPGFSVPALQQPGPVFAESTGVSLRAGKRYHIECALVDRRLTLAVDGIDVFSSLDLPACGGRPAVTRPVLLAVRGVKAIATNVSIWRDVHYTQDGSNAVRGAVVRLGPEQYFVMGDNSPRSQDSRFWPDGGAVPAANLVGVPLGAPRRIQP